MKQERLKVLNMLEEGKISADEAARLLESLKKTEKSHFWEDEDGEIEDKLKQFTKNLENFSKEIGVKMESAYRTMEPKLRQATKVVVEKTASVVDEISKSLNESLKNMEGSPKECCPDENESQDSGCCCDDGPREN